MVVVAARYVYDKHNNPTHDRQRLQPLLTVIVTRIGASDRDADESRLSTYKVNAMLNDVALTLDFVEADHAHIVDAF